MSCSIQAIEYFLPSDLVTNDSLAIEHPEWDMSQVVNRSGVVSRHLADNKTTALDLAAISTRQLLENHSVPVESIDLLIFCTQSPDYIIPPNSYLLHERLKLGTHIQAIDINLACSGYPYCLSLANALIKTHNLNTALIVNADTYSRYISTDDRATRVLFGDGAATTIIQRAETGFSNFILGPMHFSTFGQLHRGFIIPSGGCRNPRNSDSTTLHKDKSGNRRSAEHIHMDGVEILSFVERNVVQHLKEFQAKGGWSFDEIDLVIFHQASMMAIERLVQRLKIPQEKVFNNIHNIGNTVSASIPIAIKDACDAGKMKSGQQVLLCGFGAGMSIASALLLPSTEKSVNYCNR